MSKKCEDKDNKEKIKKLKLSYIDKLFIRIFLSSITLLSLVGLSNTKIIRNNLNENMNFLKYAKIFNGIFGSYIPTNDQMVSNTSYYDIINYNEQIKENEIHNYTINIVQPLTEGVVSKIVKNRNGSYDVLIVDKMGYHYTYKNLEQLEVSIYSYVSIDSIIGQSKYNESLECYSFNLLIERDGNSYDYFEIAYD